MSSSQWSLNFWIWWISSRFSFCEILFDTTSIRSIAGTGLLEHIFQPCRPVVVVVVSSRRRVDFWLRIDSMCPSRTIRVLSGAVGRRLGLVRQRPPPGRVELRQRAEVGFLFFFLSNLVSFGFGIRLVVFFLSICILRRRLLGLSTVLLFSVDWCRNDGRGCFLLGSCSFRYRCLCN